jgi:hypothetical protein
MLPGNNQHMACGNGIDIHKTHGHLIFMNKMTGRLALHYLTENTLALICHSGYLYGVGEPLSKAAIMAPSYRQQSR